MCCPILLIIQTSHQETFYRSLGLKKFSVDVDSTWILKLLCLSGLFQTASRSFLQKMFADRMKWWDRCIALKRKYFDPAKCTFGQIKDFSIFCKFTDSGYWIPFVARTCNFTNLKLLVFKARNSQTSVWHLTNSINLPTMKKLKMLKDLHLSYRLAIKSN